MKHPLFSRFIATAVLATAALGGASVAQARTDVQVSIGLPGLPGLPVFAPPPVYVRLEPVYAQPRPVYEQPQVVEYERPWRPSYRPDFERERVWRHAEWQRRDAERRELERREWQRREWQRREWEHRHDDRAPSHGRGWN